MLNRRLTFLLFGVYLGVSPVYWLPAIAPSSLRSIKLALVACALITLFFTAQKYFSKIMNKGIFGVAGFFIMVLCAAPGLLVSEFPDMVNTLISYTLVFLMLWGAYAYYKHNKHPERLLIFASVIIAAVSFLTVLNFLIGIPNFRAPAIFDGGSLSVAGFGAKRTGWSNGLALFFPLPFFLILKGRKFSVWRYGLAFFAPLMILGSQLIVAGRAGIVASILAMVGVVFFVLPKKLLIPFSAIIVIVVIGGAGIYLSSTGVSLSGSDSELKQHFRLDRLDSNDEDALNKFSAGRIGQWGCAWSKFLEEPVLGHGFSGESRCYGAAIHNLWLKLMVQSGFMVPLFLLVFVASIIRMLAKNYFRRTLVRGRGVSAIKGETAIYLAVLFQGVFISLVEPNALIGSFQATAVWWVVLGFALAQLDDLKLARKISRAQRKEKNAAIAR